MRLQRGRNVSTDVRMSRALRAAVVVVALCSIEPVGAALFGSAVFAAFIRPAVAVPAAAMLVTIVFVTRRRLRPAPI